MASDREAIEAAVVHWQGRLKGFIADRDTASALQAQAVIAGLGQALDAFLELEKSGRLAS